MVANTAKPIIGYIRVSTKRQGQSGLGLEAQTAALECYAMRTGGQILRSYKEVETGKRHENRPEIARAVAHAKRSGAVLVIAKLDRLARNVHFVSGVMESGVEFVACDNPHVNKLTIHILAAIAEHEAEQISERTKAALAAYKARGGKLGAHRPECHRFNDTDRRRGVRAARDTSRRLADEAYADLIGAIVEWRTGGMTLQAIADRLNGEGQTTRRGKRWSPAQVLRVLRRSVPGK